MTTASDLADTLLHERAYGKFADTDALSMDEWRLIDAALRAYGRPLYVSSRPDHRLLHEWHVAINRHTEGKIGSEDFPHFMYEGKTLADEVPRMAYVLRLEREGKLAQKHRQCSHSEAEPVPDNHLACCLGVECRKCPYLLALDKAELPPEQIDTAKAWTCASHILSKGGDVAREGYLLTTDDRMYWDTVYRHLSQQDDGTQDSKVHPSPSDIVGEG